MQKHKTLKTELPSGYSGGYVYWAAAGDGSLKRKRSEQRYRFQLHIVDLVIKSMRVVEETQKELKEGQGQNLEKYRDNAEEEGPSK